MLIVRWTLYAVFKCREEMIGTVAGCPPMASHAACRALAGAQGASQAVQLAGHSHITERHCSTRRSSAPD